MKSTYKPADVTTAALTKLAIEPHGGSDITGERDLR